MYLSRFPSLWPNIFTLNTTFMWGLVWRLGAGWVKDGCMMHMRKTYMQNRMVCYAVLCKLYIYPFLKMKSRHGKCLFLFGIYVYFHSANIIYSSGTILFMNGVVV